MRSEKGQAIIFLALGFVAFLGFVGLAIDAGMLYADRRQAQNGSDASSLGGAGIAALELANNSYDHPQATYPDWDCGSYWVQNAEWLGTNAAIARGGSNNFTLDTDASDLTFVDTACHNYWNGSFWDRWLDVTVGISDTTETTFARVVYPEPLRNVVSSTARVRPRAPFGFGHAIIALRHTCGNPNEGGAHFNGSNDVHIYGGGIFSNACMETSGGNNNEVIVENGDNVCVPYETDAEGNYINCYENNGDPDFSPTPSNGNPDAHINVSVPEPNCIGPVHNKVSVTGNQVVEIDPGIYPEISVQGGTLYLNPGLYCILRPNRPNQGDGNVFFNGGYIEGPMGYSAGAEDPYHSGVYFFLDKGDFTTSGNASIRLTAAMEGSCNDTPCPGIEHPAATAVLIYLRAGSSGDVTLVGTGDDVFTGLVYVPTGTANLVGNGETVSFNLQVVADTIDIGGNAILNINYDDSMQRWTSAMIELAR